MGTINHETSNYITLVSPNYDSREFEKDTDFLEYLKENNINTENETELQNAIEEEIENCISCDYENAKFTLEKYNFYFYHIVLKYSYYKGFSIQIENNFSICYNDYEEKRQAQKEITQIKKCLLEMAGNGLVACFPSWCTTYFDYKETCEMINNAIKEMREESKNIPTWIAAERKGIEI